MDKRVYLSQDKRASEDFSLEALRSGDKDEFARVVDAYSGVIYRLASKIVENPQDAEDLLSNANAEIQDDQTIKDLGKYIVKNINGIN